jgi:hypothetical protein
MWSTLSRYSVNGDKGKTISYSTFKKKKKEKKENQLEREILELEHNLTDQSISERREKKQK